MPLVSLADMKTHLGITTADYDAFLTDQLEVISSTVENYCGRKFERASYVQTFYWDDFRVPQKYLYMFHYPIISLDSATLGTEDILAQLRFHKPSGKVTRNNRQLFSFYSEEEIVFEYDAGFDEIPPIITSVVKNLVEERYNKKISGVDLNFGRDVQQISIPGTINVSFDYTLQANDRSRRFGLILGDYGNVLDPFRSERPIVGSIKENYVE